MLRVVQKLHSNWSRMNPAWSFFLRTVSRRHSGSRERGLCQARRTKMKIDIFNHVFPRKFFNRYISSGEPDIGRVPATNGNLL